MFVHRFEPWVRALQISTTVIIVTNTHSEFTSFNSNDFTLQAEYQNMSPKKCKQRDSFNQNKNN